MRGCSRLAWELRSIVSHRATSSYEPPENMSSECSAPGGRRAAPRLVSANPSALVEAAGQTLLAALLVHERRLTALLAEVADPPARLHLRRLHGARVLELPDVLGQRAGQGVGQRQDLAGAEPHRLRTANPRELADDLFESPLSRERRRQPQRERNQPTESLGDGHRVGAALAHLHEDLERLAV